MGAKWLIICVIAAKYVSVSTSFPPSFPGRPAGRPLKYCRLERAFSSGSFEYDSKYKFPSQRNWFLKKITVGLFTAGRLTTTQINSLSEIGYKGIISQYKYIKGGTFGKDVLPNTIQSRQLVTR